jgi:hypothetical protein
VATWFDATAEEHEAIRGALEEARQLIDARDRPDGYNIGANVGRADPAAALARRSSPASLALCHNPDTLDA